MAQNFSPERLPCCRWRCGSAHSPPVHHLPQGVAGVVHRHLILHFFPPPPFLWDSLTPALPSGPQSYYCRCSAEQVSLSGHPTSCTIMSFTQTAHHAADVPGHQNWGRGKDESVQWGHSSFQASHALFFPLPPIPHCALSGSSFPLSTLASVSWWPDT